ncbi:hypothetical protein NSK_007824 [Nannochloropsis salina CCMP1776]|uniref:Tr-type G domain-containing protein n=1 Tax=Nannochloropsis salina CCMP1776 TaxID=1027361 RepID=A0A4D9CQN7_9STRA|nr:hypothetical protein NSK_007824 [Nannochloropsis salina CCMP1776]|eukprot:TFJ80824.1 hypothetical protein NSK_007824 [Nannochloropsis salina CCMP1776]
MGPKKGTAGPAAAKTEDEDLDALLTQYKAEVGIKEGEDAAAAKEEEESDDEETAGGGKEEGEKKEDKKKKKKKKKPAERKEAAVADAKAAAGGKMSAQAKMILARQKALQEEEERLQQQREEEEKKIAAERAAEEAELAAKEEEKRLKKEKARAKMEKQKAEGTYMTKAQREKAMRARIALEQMKAAGMIAEGVGEGGAEGGGKPKRPVYGKKKKKPQPPPPPPPETAQEAPGQVPTSAVEEHGGEEEKEEGVGEGRGEAPAVDEDVPEDWESGPVEALAARVAHLDLQHHAHGYYEDEEDEMHKEREREREQYRLLGLARKKREDEERARHESFTNLRSRGSTLCDIAILVIDLMHGLEPQTIESLQLLRRKRTPFVVALNKVDRCYAWKSIPNGPFRASLEAQEENTRREFQDRTDRIIVQLMEQVSLPPSLPPSLLPSFPPSLPPSFAFLPLALALMSINSDLYWKNEDTAHTVSLVPTSVGGLVELGVVTSIQSNHKELQQVGKGIQAAIKIENTKNPNIMFGRHFTAENPVYSRITRESIDALKSHFKDELSNDDWRLVIDLKKVFGIL